MYESYWKLDTKPFESTSDARFYYPSETHQGATLKLRYAIENRRGAVALAGAAGLGKTLLLRTLAEQLGESYSPVVHVVFPQMPHDQLLAYLADELTGERMTGPTTVDQSIHRIMGVLSAAAQEDRHTLIIIDEAHLLDDSDSLEMLRLLLNFEHNGQPALSLLLAGHPQLLATLDRTPELDERIAVKCLLRRMTVEETMSYISHRLQAAGSDSFIFEQDAMEAIHEIAQGVPRRINRLCDLALLIGYAEERASLTSEQIETVAEELVTVAPE